MPRLQDVESARRLSEAVASGDSDKIWEAYKSSWSSGFTASMTAETFVNLFRYNFPRVVELQELARNGSPARKTLNDLLSGTGFTPALIAPANGDCWAAAFAALGVENVVQRWLDERFELEPGKRQEVVYSLVEALLREEGVQRFERRVRKWWDEQSFIDEEERGILRALANNGRLSPALLKTLRVASPHRIGVASSPRVARERIDSLLRTVSVRADLKDSRLTPRELASVSTSWPGFLGLALSYRRWHPMMDELFEALLHGPAPWGVPDRTPAAPEHQIAFPLIRLFHLRLILEAPALAPALARPEDGLVPEVLFWMLSRDAVTYWPELRVHAGAERRWRARWVESSAEAASVLLLEDAVGLDLSTLARIEERADQETPDFQAQTTRGEPVVIESKGSAHWGTHLAQRRKALRQLRKGGAGEPKALATSGRSFGCALFAAQEGDERSSLMHVADPPFGFAGLFGEGWQRAVRRQHYAAIAQVALMHELAGRLLERGGEIGRTAQEAEMYTLGDGENGSRYRGASFDLDEYARFLRQPGAKHVASARMFLGMDEAAYVALSRGVLPQDSDNDPASSNAPPVGLVPGAKRGPARGVYSRLSDGAFLAVELK